MRSTVVILGALTGLGLGHPAARAGAIPAEDRRAVETGLDWLVKQQARDGSWPDVGGQSDVTCTAVAGLALLMEGSTATRGKYAPNVQRALDWVVQSCQEGEDDGLIGAHARQDRAGYMVGQGYAVLFLASALAREEKPEATGVKARLARARQQEMAGVLGRAVRFVVKAQARSGGWGPVAARGGPDQHDAAATLAQVLALRAARQAGAEVPRETMRKAFAYLERLTSRAGGVHFSSTLRGGERPSLTIAAFACTYGAEEASPALLKRWLGYCQFAFSEQASDAYGLFHMAVAVHGLGDNGYAKLVGAREGVPAWSKDRATLLRRFRSAGPAVHRGWHGSPVFGTAINLIALQLDNDHLPVFRMKKDW